MASSKKVERKRKIPASPIKKIPSISNGFKTEKSKKRKAKEEGEVDDIGTGEDGTTRMCSFSMARIKRIINREETGFKLPQDVVFLVNKAMEMFMEQFCEEAYDCSVQDRKKSIAYKHLSSAVSKRKRFDFLSDVVPEKLTAEEASERRKLVETR